MISAKEAKNKALAFDQVETCLDNIAEYIEEASDFGLFQLEVDVTELKDTDLEEVMTILLDKGYSVKTFTNTTVEYDDFGEPYNPETLNLRINWRLA